MNRALDRDVKGKKVFVGLSGGVDSGVTAALLKEKGAHVVGVFIKGWYPPGLACTWASDRRDAMRVAAHLGIPFVTLDASAEYKKGVIDYLLREYARGNTPNPDIMCNREVKFGAFYTYAKAHGADFVATGHYARSTADGVLLRGVDMNKDQSYFLWAVPKEVLAHTLFPLGEYQKTEVRAFAKKYNLPNATKADSQGICFLGSISVEEFLQQEIGSVEGRAIDSEGEVVGTHGGALLYTTGTRIALTDAPPGPWYVVGKDMEKNSVTVSHSQLQPTEGVLVLSDTNFFSEPGLNIEAQYRYHGPLVKGTYDKASQTFTPTTTFPEPVASGQSLVLYDGETCIGGAIIG